MANAVFSPKDFKAWIIEETTAGNGFASGVINPNAPAITANLYQLDVDSVAFPSISPNQVLNVRTRSGRTLSKSDFFQDNAMKATEVTLSGVYHKDVGTLMLMQSVAGQNLDTSYADVVAVSATHTGLSGKYGTTGANTTFTLVLAPPDTTDGYNTILRGCVVTSFSISADAGTDGGQYKFSATISSGLKPITNNAQTPAGTVFGTSSLAMSSLTTVKVGAVDAILNSFNFTLEHPAVYTGFQTDGYQCFGRGEEFLATAEATVKYDSVTRDLYHNFNNQASATEGNMLGLVQSTPTDTSIYLPDAVFTDVAFNEGDMMMLDVSMKGVNDEAGSNLFSIDLA